MEQQKVQNSRAPKQRSVRTEAQILAIIEEYEGSGFTVKEFCEVSDINDATFYSWLNKYRPKNEEEAPGCFAKLEVVPAFSSARPQLFAEIGNIKLYKEVSVEYLKTLL
jgi:transposase-like protein